MDKTILWIGVCILIMNLVAGAGWTGTYGGVYTDPTGAGSIDNNQGGLVVLGNYAYMTSYDDDYFTIVNITNPNSPVVAGSVTDAAGDGTIDQAQWLDVYDDVAYICSNADAALTSYNVSDPAAPVFLDTYTNTVNPCNVSRCNRPFAENRSDGQIWIHLTAYDNRYIILNATNPTSMTCLSNYSSTGAGSVEGGRDIAIDSNKNLSYTCSETDDMITVLNYTNVLNTPVMVESYQSSDGLGTIDQCSGVRINNDATRLYVSSRADSAITVLNISDPLSITALGTYANASKSGMGSLSSIYDLEIMGDNYVFGLNRGYNSDAKGGVTAINFTNPASPTVLGHFNTTSGTCVFNQTKRINVKDNWIFVISQTDDCFYSINGTTLISETGGSTDSCTYSGTGDWTIQGTDNCVITTNTNVAGNILINGAGSVTIAAIIDIAVNKMIAIMNPAMSLIIRTGGTIA